MKDKYANLGKEYADTIHELAQAAGWPEEQAGKVLAVIMRATEEKANTVSEQRQRVKKHEKLDATRNLLKNYRWLK